MDGNHISLDTNVWVFALGKKDLFCEQILKHIDNFEITVPDRIRIELEDNLSLEEKKIF